MAEFAMNNAPNEASGQTPFVLNYGINPMHPNITKLTKLQLNGHPVEHHQSQNNQNQSIYGNATLL
jgi:hypothetical protein